MTYVSAKYAPLDDSPIAIPEVEGDRSVLATDTQGVVWSLRESSQVGEWLEYIEGGGTIDAADTQPTQQPAPNPTGVPRAQPDMTMDGDTPRLG